jgi:hypothetical protein
MRRLLSRTRYVDAASESALARRLRRLSSGERKEEERAFLASFHDASGAGLDRRRARWAEVRRQIGRTGIYVQTPEELGFRGTARLAQLGALYWAVVLGKPRYHRL